MLIARTSMLMVAALLAAGTAFAQVPDDLRAAMQARDRAFYAVDPAQWENTRPGIHDGSAGRVVPDQG